MVAISDLPQELVDKIVGEFKDDEDNLRICSLISPTFVSTTRQHLFASVRLLNHNVYPFQALIKSSPSVAAYVRRVNISVVSGSPVVLVAPATLARLPNLTDLVAHHDPFGFRHLSSAQESMLADTVHRLTTVELFLHELWTLPAWAAHLNGCPLLATLVVSASAGFGTWSAADVAGLMPSSLTSTPNPGVLRLRTLYVAGDCKVLTPLGAWLIPQGALAALETLALNVTFWGDDYLAEDRRVPLLQATASSLRKLKLNLDPHLPASIKIAMFPNLRALHLHDGFDAEFSVSLDWIVMFLCSSSTSIPSNTPSHQTMHERAIEHIFLDHATTRERLLAIPASAWAALEDALLGHSDAVVPHLCGLTLAGYASTAVFVPQRRADFAQLVHQRLPRLVSRGMLVVG